MKKIFQNPLFVTVGIIVAYWVYSIVDVFISETSLPPTVEGILFKIFLLKSIVLFVIYLLMRHGKVKFSDLGLTSKKIIPSILRGIGFGLLAFALINIGLNTFMQSINPNAEGGINMANYFKEVKYLPFWILLTIYGGGITEEIQRIFILTRFEALLGKYGLYIALFIDTVIFGLGHLYQGMNGAILASLSGFIFALVYLRKRSAVEAITCHAVYDVTGVIIGHLMVN